MAPSEKAIVAELHDTIKSMYAEDPETLTVRNVRNKVEAELGLKEGFLSSETWKAKSKTIITDYAVRISLQVIV